MMIAGHRYSVAGGADGDTEVVFTFFDGSSHRVGKVGIVAAIGGVRAVVGNVGAA